MAETRTTSQRAQRIAAWLLLAGAVAVLLAAAVPLLPPGRAVAALEAGRPHLATVGLGLLGGTLLLRSVPRAAVAVAFAATLAHAAALRPVPAAPPVEEPARAWRLVTANLGSSPDLMTLAGWIADTRPDAVSLQELQPGQAAEGRRRAAGLLRRLDAAPPRRPRRRAVAA